MMIGEALRQTADWGSQLAQQGMQVALDAKTVMMVVGLAVGATVWINDRVAMGPNPTAGWQPADGSTAVEPS